MKWKRVIRASGLIEWQCEHGVGHPDEESIERMNKASEEYYLKHGMEPEKDGDYGWGIHGCCEERCCNRDDFPGKRRVSVKEH